MSTQPSRPARPPSGSVPTRRWAALLAAVALLVATACGATAAEPQPAPAPSTAPSTGPSTVPSTGPSTVPSTGPSTGPSTPAGVAAAARAYVDAVNARDLDALVAAFAPDAEIVDVSRSIRGHDAIREWAGNEVVGGTLRVVSIAENRADGQKLLVHWAPAGSDGWRAHYDFTVRDGRVVRADLQYA
ncbi:nuclear transport factor 2 family protein [Nonomuraea sp. KM90]|uniref:nuclear transport factor 2 family protein n=1 Tax=Nonomuraea sp. KM90 TaxID=3457428 RepID=UPI003FCCC127